MELWLRPILNMFRKVANKQYKKSIFNSIIAMNKLNIQRDYTYPLLIEFRNILADPKLNYSQVAREIDVLLKKDIKLINMHDEYQYTPLMSAICNSINYLETTERIKLLLDMGANPNAIAHGAYGYTPLLLSIKDVPISHAIVKLLIKYGCTVDERAVWQSVMFGSFDTVRLLEQHYGKSISDMKDKHDKTVLNYAELFTRDEDFKYRLCRHYEQQKLKSLIKKE